MKTVVVMYEGAADVPVESLGGRTPLQVTHAPHATRLAREGRCGLLAPFKGGLEGRGEFSLAVLLGVPAEAAKDLRRGPVEAAGVALDAGEYGFAYAGNFVTLDGEVLRDCRVRRLSLEETRSLAAALQNAWRSRHMAVAAGAPGRVTVLCDAGDDRPAGIPPCLVEGEKFAENLPGGKGGGFLRDVLLDSGAVLQSQTVNDVRLDLAEDPANGLWLWGGGALADAMRVFEGRKTGGLMITQSPVARGVGALCGMTVEAMDDPWSMEQPGRPAFDPGRVADALAGADVVVVYVEAPVKLGQYGTALEKVRAIEALDQRVLGPLLAVLDAGGEYRIALASDGVVSTPAGRPASGRVPLVLAGDGVSPDGGEHWDEEVCSGGSLGTVKLAKLPGLVKEGG